MVQGMCRRCQCILACRAPGSPQVQGDRAVTGRTVSRWSRRPGKRRPPVTSALVTNAAWMGGDHPQGGGGRFDFSLMRGSSENLCPTSCCQQKPADIKAQSYGDAQTELHVGAAEVAQLAGDDRLTLGAGDPLHRQHDVVD